MLVEMITFLTSFGRIIEHLVLLGQAECAVERDDTKYKNKHN